MPPSSARCYYKPIVVLMALAHTVPHAFVGEEMNVCAILVYILINYSTWNHRYWIWNLIARCLGFPRHEKPRSDPFAHSRLNAKVCFRTISLNTFRILSHDDERLQLGIGFPGLLISNCLSRNIPKRPNYLHEFFFSRPRSQKLVNLTLRQLRVCFRTVGSSNWTRG